MQKKERDSGSVPGLRRVPGGGHGNSLQYSCLKNSMDRGAWQAMATGSQKVGHNWRDLACTPGTVTIGDIMVAGGGGLPWWVRNKKKKRIFFLKRQEKKCWCQKRRFVCILAVGSSYRTLHSNWYIVGMEKAIRLLQPISSNLSEISYIIEMCRFFLMKWPLYLYMGRIVVRWWTFIPSPGSQHYRFPVSLDSFINLFIWQIFIEQLLWVRHCLECWGIEENEVVSIHKDLSSVRERRIQQINFFFDVDYF